MNKIVIGNPEEKGPLGGPRGRWEDIIMELREIGWEGVDWMHLVQDRDQSLKCQDFPLAELIS
jgi:hypothetical protein